MEKHFAKLPIDVIFNIIRYLDIESRMALGIVSKMNIPKKYIDNISSILNKINVYNSNSRIIAVLDLKSLYILRQSTIMRENNINVEYYIEHNINNKNIIRKYSYY